MKQARSKELVDLVWFVAPFAMTGTLCLTSLHPVTLAELLLTFALFAIPCRSYDSWRLTRDFQLPLFAIIAGVHAIFFAVPVFWGTRQTITYSGEGELSDASITAVLAMALCGVVALYLGMRSGQSRRLGYGLPDIPQSIHRWWLVQFIALLGIASGLNPRIELLGAEYRQIFSILFIFVPIVAFLMLCQAWLKGRATGLDKALVVLFLAGRLVGGLASGSLGSCVGVFLLAGVTYVRYRRRAPIVAAAVLIAVMIFLQAGKGAFRDQYWSTDSDASIVEKASFWLNASTDQLLGRNSQVEHRGESLVTGFVSRASLLSQAAVVYEKTPAVVPFQYGATYRYLLITLVPRFVWPDKPSVNDANRFFQVAYGITRQEDLNSVAIGAGLIPEAYMNFGWPGVFAIMFTVGFVLNIIQRMFLRRDCGAFASAIGLAFIPQIMVIESQVSVYVGGIVQYIVLTFLVFWLVLTPPRKRAATGRLPRPSRLTPASPGICFRRLAARSE